MNSRNWVIRHLKRDASELCCKVKRSPPALKIRDSFWEEPRMTPAEHPVESDGNPTGFGSIDEALSIFLNLRARLFGIAYRILGSAADAEDVRQAPPIITPSLMMPEYGGTRRGSRG